MSYRLTPLAAVISTTLFVSHFTYAAGGATGANGSNTFTSGAAVNLIGGESYGLPSPSAGSIDGGNVDGKTLEVRNVSVTGGDGGDGGSNVNPQSSYGGGGAGGVGGASVIGAITIGGASEDGSGGNAGSASNNNVSLLGSVLTGGAGGEGGETQYAATGRGGSGAGGHGGASVFGAISAGGAGGLNAAGTLKNGGSAGATSNNVVTVQNSKLDGALAHGGNSKITNNAGGAGGNGGGSVFGAISAGGAAGYESDSDGGNGGAASNNTVRVSGSTLIGGNGGLGGNANGGGGAGGHGGGSVFGAISSGASGSYGSAGSGGDASNNTVIISQSTLTGGAGGAGGNVFQVPGAGAGGYGGGSVFGSISTGGAGGYTRGANGGDAGNVSLNTISLTDVQLIAGAKGTGGTDPSGPHGDDGLEGGSVFGGVSFGGSGGYGGSGNNGGSGGDASQNVILVSGASSISGDIYGGYSRGGVKGGNGNDGQGGSANRNTITLNDDNIRISGAIYGGLSLNGDGNPNLDPTFTSFYQGNTLNITGFKGAVQGVYNFETYNWVLPKDVVNQGEVITITGSGLVQLDNTKHTIHMENDGNVLHAGDTIILISRAQGAPLETPSEVRQGLFIVYDVNVDVENDQFVLKIADEFSNTPQGSNPPDDTPDGRLDPRSKVFLHGRLPALASLNHGADMISDYGIDAARSVLGNCGSNMFVIGNGGSSRYDTGSHIKVRDVDVAIGGAKCFVLPSQSTAMLGVFAEHGSGHFDTSDSFARYGAVHGSGDTRYSGAGLLFHMNVASTGVGKSAAAPSIAEKDGLYVNSSVRAGRSKTSFDSGLSAAGVRGRYHSKANYASLAAGLGYAWQIDAKQQLDIYGRYTFSRIGSDSVRMGRDVLHVDAMKSSRARAGARYLYTEYPFAVPYLGLAYEHEFDGKSSGSVYDLAIDEPSLKGGSTIVEVGAAFKPSKNYPAWTVNVGLQGFFGRREGTSGGVTASYEF